MSKLSIQQLPKTKDFMQIFKAQNGKVLVYTDFNSIEPHAMTHFTRDKGLMSVYGPDAGPNDIYLLTASGINKWKDEVSKYFNPKLLTRESVDKAKKELKDIRTKVKPIYLGWLYGLGPETMHVQTGMSSEECKVILDDISSFYSGVSKFNKKLKQEWESNGGYAITKWVYDPALGKNKPIITDGAPGWIYNGRGRPLGVSPHKAKDLVNMHIQSTSHDVLMAFIQLINSKRLERSIKMRPYHVDMHDATTWEVDESDAELARKVFLDSYDELNSMLGWSVQVRGDVEIGTSLADFI